MTDYLYFWPASGKFTLSLCGVIALCVSCVPDCGIFCFHEISRTFTSSKPFLPTRTAAVRAMVSSRYNLHLRFERMKVVQYIWADERINLVTIAGHRGFRLLTKLRLSLDNYWFVSCWRSHCPEGISTMVLAMNITERESTVKLKRFPAD